jgi:hypothetical protein
MSNNTFVNDKLTIASTQSDKSLKRLEVFLRPTEKNEFFRFRLLWFNHEGSGRKVPYIERWIHQVWEDGEDGKRKLNEIICPISKHVAETWPGNPYDNCPVCKFANMNFVAFKDSSWKDKVAANNSKVFKRKYDLVVPVYIVSDPCYSNNVGKIRVFRINDSKVGDKFKKMIVAKSAEASIFNGGKALDFIIRMDKVKYEREDGSFWTKNEIVQMGFTNKPYEIAGITPELIDAFPFDDYFGAIPTVSDLKEWHRKYCLHADNDDIDLDGISDMNAEETAPAPKAAPEIPEEDASDIPADFDEEGLDSIADSNESLANEDPFAGLPPELRADEAETISTPKPKAKAPATDDIDIDAILAKAGVGD